MIGERVEELAAEVIDRLAPIEKEVLCADRRRYEIRVLPYKTLDHSIKGAVIIMVDAVRSTDLRLSSTGGKQKV